MLGSCSKDDTETAAVEVKGKVAFSAVMSIDTGNETRTHVVNNKYIWDQGDMLTASVIGNAEVIPFVVKNGGSSEAEFTVVKEDLNYLGEGPYYLTYPDSEATVQSTATDGSDATIEMTIPAKQRYRENSFAATTAPAVGMIDDYKEGKTFVELQPVSSFLRVPVTGFGKLKSLKLEIEDKNGNNYYLSGTDDVPFSGNEKDQYALVLNDQSTNAAQAVTVSFGATPYELSYNKPINVWFVIPANLELPEATVIFTPEIEGVTTPESVEIKIPAGYSDNGKTYMARNKCLPVSNPIMVGLEDKVVVNNEADFIKYVYAVKQNENTYKDQSGAFKTAVVVSNLDFATFNANQAAQANKDDVLMVQALNEYQGNNGYLSSIVAGANIAGIDNTITIANMKVSGHIFAGSTTVKNIIFDHAVVDAKNTSDVYIYYMPTAENVKIVNPAFENLPADVKGAMYKDFTSDLLANASKIVVEFNEALPYLAHNFILNGSVDVSEYGNESEANYFGDILRVEKIVNGNATCDIIYGLEAGVPVDNVLATVNTETNPISVMSGKPGSGDAVSYWTGSIPTKYDSGDGIVTAEELAFAVLNGGDVELTNDIDLRGAEGKEWLVGAGTLKIDGTKNLKENYTISNALVGRNAKSVNYAAYSLLGNVVNATNLNVKSVTINVPSVEAETRELLVGGLGYQGSANSVNVEGMTINIDEDADFNGEDYNQVAGLISDPNTSNSVSNESNNNTVSDLIINVNENETVGLVAGMFANAPVKFDGNTVSYHETAATKYAMIGAWTLTDDAEVNDCHAEGAYLIEALTVDASDGGHMIHLNMVDCTADDFVHVFINANNYLSSIMVNDNVIALQPAE